MIEANSTKNNDSQIHPVIHRLLKKKNFNATQMNEFLSWNLKELPDLSQMKDLDKAVDRLVEAIMNNEKIGIYGDYDVDGTTSCALLAHFFSWIDIDVELFQPSRFIEGYGVHVSSIEAALLKQVKVLITVDCGITSLEAAEYATNNELDLIITDHHKDGAAHLPNAFAVVNPNRRDEDPNSPLKDLAGVGVAFALLVKLRTKLMEEGLDVPSLYPLLPFVAIGTISDLAYLSPLNLKLCRHGLKEMTKTKFPGLLAFFAPEELKVPMILSEKVAFNIGPMINSKGRLDHPERALKLMMAQTPEEAKVEYLHLEMCNRERRFIQHEVFDQAKKEVLKQIQDPDPVITVVYQPEWHEGVVGIVAAKLVETFNAPAIVLTNAEEEGVIKGSARTSGELNIFDTLKECEELFIKFGGHKAAAGLSLKKENLNAFKNKVREVVKQIPHAMRSESFLYDLEIYANEIESKLVKDLQLLEPFGSGNEKPTFRLNQVKLVSYKVLKETHVKWHFQSIQDPKVQLQGISFNYINKWDTLTPDEIFKGQEKADLSVYFTLGINRFNGNEFIQLMVDQLKLGL